MAVEFLKFTIQDGKPIPHSEVQPTGGGKTQTRKELVTLPKFTGDEKMGQPFLTYPIWLTDWKSHIVDYEDKSRANMLLSHLDREAKK